MKYTFGIDFGTSSCGVVGHVIEDNGEDKVFQYWDDAGRAMPSAVAIDKNTGKVYVGSAAWEKQAQLQETCVYFSSVKTALDKDEDITDINGENWTNERVATEIFKELKNIVREAKKIEMKSATVAIPVGFNPAKREKIRSAAAAAGISINSMISEPTAAFYAHSDKFKECTNVVVFDWGGGTLDVSVLKNKDNCIYEIATVGMQSAGDDIDELLCERIHNSIVNQKKEKGKFALSEMPPVAIDNLRIKAEQAKRDLSDNGEADIVIFNYGPYGACKVHMSYDWFAEIVDSTVNSALECLDRAIEESGLGLGNIDQIILTGGSSQLQPLLDKIETKFPLDKIVLSDNPIWDVATGTAIIDTYPGEYYSNQNISVVLSDGSDFNLLEKGTCLTNWKKSFNFGLVDNSEVIRVVFGGSPDIKAMSVKNCSLEDPGFKFLDEVITLEAIVTNNMIFTVNATSSRRSTKYNGFWEYFKLKTYYKR